MQKIIKNTVKKLPSGYVYKYLWNTIEFLIWKWVLIPRYFIVYVQIFQCEKFHNPKHFWFQALWLWDTEPAPGFPLSLDINLDTQYTLSLSYNNTLRYKQNSHALW